jgi:nicotinamide-nucleotide amidase
MWFGPSPASSPKAEATAKAPSRWEGGQGVVFVSLPGVPHEMKGLMTDSVIPKLRETFDLPVVFHRTLLTSGIGESMLADAIADFENSLPSHVKLAYLPAYGMVRLRLTARGSERNEIETELDTLFTQLKSLVQEWMIADKDISLQEGVIRLLKSKNKTISTAESCTGGNIAHLITSISGSSAVYNGSIVSYANNAKENLLGVKKETVKQFGAVSEQTVTEMLQGALNGLKTDYAVATSGIMGPDGGSAEKPVGTVWIAVGNKQKIKASKHFFRFDRARNIELTSHTALTMLFRFVKEQEGE